MATRSASAAGRSAAIIRIAQRVDRATRLVEPGRRKPPSRDHSGARLLGSSGVEKCIDRVELEHQASEAVREHVVDVASDAGALGEGRPVLTLLGEAEPVVEQSRCRRADERYALRLIPTSAATSRPAPAPNS